MGAHVRMIVPRRARRDFEVDLRVPVSSDDISGSGPWCTADEDNFGSAMVHSSVVVVAG